MATKEATIDEPRNGDLARAQRGGPTGLRLAALADSIDPAEGADHELARFAEGSDPARIEPLRDFVEGNPGYPDACYRLARLHWQRGEYAEASRRVEEALVGNPQYAAALRLKSTLMADHEGSASAALEVIEQVLQTCPTDAPAHYQRAVLLDRLGQRSQAIDAACKAVASDAKFFLAHLFLGERYLYESRWQESRRHYERANDLWADADLCYLLGLLELRLGKIDEGQRHLERALLLEPSHVNAGIRLAICKVYIQDHATAYDLLVRTLGYHPAFADLHFCVAKICLLLGRREEALTRMQAALTLNPDYAAVRREIGYLYSTQHRTADAADELQHSIELDPRDESAPVNLGFLLSNQGQYERAVEVLEAAINRFPNSWRSYQALGVIHLQQQAYPAAQTAFLEAVRIEPEVKAAQHELRQLFQDETLLDRRRAELEASLAAPDQTGELEHRLGRLYLDFHQERAALGHLERSRTVDFDPVANGILVATIHANRQDQDVAINVLESIEADGPRDTIRNVLLGLFHANVGDYDHSARWYQRVMSEDPLTLHAMDGLPVCFREREEVEDLLDDYSDYARFQERNPDLLCRIGELNAQRGLLVEARQHFRHATVLDAEHARSHHALGVLALLALDAKTAHASFEQACHCAPGWGLPWLNLGLLDVADGRQESASAAFRRYVELEPQPVWRDRALSLLVRLERELAERQVD